MGHHTTVYGRIKGATWKTDDYYRLHRLNAEVINNLPGEDEVFPWLNRSMFSIANTQGVYRNQIITFGASYKTLEYEWDEWLIKFEEILKQLFFYDAVIHVDFEIMGEYMHEWEIEMEKAKEFWYRDTPVVYPTFRYKGNGPRSFKEVL